MHELCLAGVLLVTELARLRHRHDGSGEPGIRGVGHAHAVPCRLSARTGRQVRAGVHLQDVHLSLGTGLVHLPTTVKRRHLSGPQNRVQTARRRMKERWCS